MKTDHDSHIVVWNIDLNGVGGGGGGGEGRLTTAQLHLCLCNNVQQDEDTVAVNGDVLEDVGLAQGMLRILCGGNKESQTA